MSGNFRTILGVRIGVGPDWVPNVVHLECNGYRGATSRVGVDDDDASIIAVAGKCPERVGAGMIVVYTDVSARESAWRPRMGMSWGRGAAMDGLWTV